MSQRYLGRVAEGVAKLSGSWSGEPVRSQRMGFGDVAAVGSMLERLDVSGVVDAVAPRYANAAASVGTYIALAPANRIVDPCSKRAFADWWSTTAGPRWVKVADAALDHRRFWDAMDRLPEADLRTIETELSRRMVAEFGLDLSGLVLDMTNFATCIDTANDKARRSPSAARRSRSAPTCVWSASRWSSPATAGYPWSPTPTPATGPTSPSSPPSSPNS